MTYRISPRGRKDTLQEKDEVLCSNTTHKKQKKLHEWGDKIILKFKGRKIK